MNGYQLITLWCEQFVGRAPSPQDIANGQALQTQAQAVALLAAVASCDEAYAHLNGSQGASAVQTYAGDAAWLAAVFPLLTNGQQPTYDQLNGFQDLMAMDTGMSGRQRVAGDVLIEYPPTF